MIEMNLLNETHTKGTLATICLVLRIQNLFVSLINKIDEFVTLSVNWCQNTCKKFKTELKSGKFLSLKTQYRKLRSQTYPISTVTPKKFKHTINQRDFPQNTDNRKFT